jgi:outer membrane protein
MLCLFMLAAANAFAQPVKIGFVNPFRIEAESAQAKVAVDDLKKEFAPRDKQLQDMERQLTDLRAQLDKTSASLSANERQAREKDFIARSQRFEQMKVAFGEDFEARRRDALAKVVADANSVIKSIAEAQKFDLILQEAVYFGNQIDITDQVLKAMERQSGRK